MRVVAHAAGLVVRITRGIEVGQLGAHLVTAEAFLGAGAQRAGRRVAGGEQRDVGRELMAHDAVESCLTGHLPQPDFGTDVTARLPAG